MTQEIETIIDRNDRLLKSLEDETIKRLEAALDGAYKQLEKELLKAYQQHSANKSLLPNQRKLLILNEVQELLRLVNPGNEAAIDKSLQSLLSKASEMGVDLASQLTQAITNEPLKSFAGIPLKAVVIQAQEGRNRLKNHSEQFASKASAIVEMGLIQGSGTQKIARQLRAELGTTKGKAETIARTESLSSLNQAAQQTYKDNGIQYLQWIATRSERTCSICVARSGNVYRLGSVMIPAHPRCKCVGLPYRKEWQQLGLTDDEWTNEFHKEGVKELEAIGKTPDYTGLSPFEKMAGATNPPDPIWKPGG